jgi:hypothetical protein
MIILGAGVGPRLLDNACRNYLTNGFAAEQNPLGSRAVARLSAGEKLRGVRPTGEHLLAPEPPVPQPSASASRNSAVTIGNGHQLP